MNIDMNVDIERDMRTLLSISISLYEHVSLCLSVYLCTFLLLSFGVFDASSCMCMMARTALSNIPGSFDTLIPESSGVSGIHLKRGSSAWKPLYEKMHERKGAGGNPLYEHEFESQCKRDLTLTYWAKSQELRACCLPTETGAGPSDARIAAAASHFTGVFLACA